MKRWVRLASYLYPGSWRRRYAAEFDAMLDEVDAGWPDFFDTLKGALLMQFTSWNLKTITLAFTVIGAVIAAATAFGIRSQYQSTAVMRLSATNPGDPNAQTEMLRHLNVMEQEILSRTSLSDIITRLDLYKGERQSQPMEEIVQDMRNHEIMIRMISAPGSRGNATIAAAAALGFPFSISFTYPDPKLAQAATRELITKFTEENVVVARRVRGAGEGGLGENLEVLDPASIPEHPIFPKRAQLVALGALAGLLTGLIVAYALRWRIVIVRRPAR